MRSGGSGDAQFDCPQGLAALKSQRMGREDVINPYICMDNAEAVEMAQSIDQVTPSNPRGLCEGCICSLGPILR